MKKSIAIIATLVVVITQASAPAWATQKLKTENITRTDEIEWLEKSVLYCLDETVWGLIPHGLGNGTYGDHHKVGRFTLVVKDDWAELVYNNAFYNCYPHKGEASVSCSPQLKHLSHTIRMNKETFRYVIAAASPRGSVYNGHLSKPEHRHTDYMRVGLCEKW